MGVRVQIAFNLSLTTPVNFFTLDDATRGVLDNTTYVLGGDVLVDVTSDVQEFQIRRGRSRQLEKFTTGNANFTLLNYGASARKYDPTNTASPYYGSILPRKQVVIDIDGTPLFTGNIADWNYTYDVSGQSLAQTSCVDALAVVSSQTLTGGTETVEKTGARVGKILDQIGWSPILRTISTGEATLDANVVSPDTNALNYLSQVADVSEPGAIFVGKAGDFVFKSRSDLQSFTSSVTFGTGGIPMTGMDVEFGTQELFNDVSVTYTAGSVTGGTATAIDSASVTAYGTFNKTYQTVLGSAVDAADMATWQASVYSQPKYRINSLTVAYTALSSVQQAEVLGLELGSVVLVTWTPNSTGSALSQYVTIDEIEHRANPSFHEITFTLSETTAAFILDSATFGVLDSTTPLGF
jgi:hypothetical protein